MKKIRSTVGFTLIELLVVMSVIALILAVSMPNFLGARQRARDAQKKATLNQLKTALRLYYNDYGTYPAYPVPPPVQLKNIYGCGAAGTDICLPTTPACAYGEFLAGGDGCSTATVYMKKLPLNTAKTNLAILGYDINYYRVSTGDDFRLNIDLENAADPDIATSQARCPTLGAALCSGGKKYCVCAD